MLGFIENYGKGLKRIKETYAHENHKAVLDNLEHSFIVELPDLNYFKEQYKRQDVPNVPNIVPKTDESIIVDAIRKSPNISRESLAKLIGKSEKTVSRIINASSKIIRVGSKRTGHWEIID